MRMVEDVLGWLGGFFWEVLVDLISHKLSHKYHSPQSVWDIARRSVLAARQSVLIARLSLLSVRLSFLVVSSGLCVLGLWGSAEFSNDVRMEPYPEWSWFDGGSRIRMLAQLWPMLPSLLCAGLWWMFELWLKFELGVIARLHSVKGG